MTLRARAAATSSISSASVGPERAARLVNIEPTPLASASIAQVHTATLHDGTEVVVKVQRPDIERTMRADLDLLNLGAQLLETGIDAFEIETVCHYSCRLVNGVGKLMEIDLGHDIKTWHSSTPPGFPAPTWTHAARTRGALK